MSVCHITPCLNAPYEERGHPEGRRSFLAPCTPMSVRAECRFLPASPSAVREGGVGGVVGCWVNLKLLLSSLLLMMLVMPLRRVGLPR